MLWKRLKVLWWDHKFWFAVALVVGALVCFSIVGLGSLDSFFLQQILGTLPLELLKAIVWSILGAYFFVVLIYRVGMPMSGSSGSTIRGSDSQVSFKDVIGLTEAKREAMEVVALIKDRAKVRKIGGKVIRGLLMVGPPGCGKTYLAKAIANEAGVPFFSIAGSEFVEVFVGVGPGRVRKIFKKAKSAAFLHGAAILFIDELDAIGQGRKFSMFGSSESDNTLNQLLVNMDGLAREEGGNVIVIGATNAAEGILDPALLRPGRFDRRINISKPNLRDREELFRYYLQKVKADASIDVTRLAHKTVGKSPAEVENVVKEAALISLRNQRDYVTLKDMAEAIERIDLGLETHLELTPRERERTAYHESGHLLVLYRQHPTDDVFKASIKTRGGALGVVYHHPREELYTETRDEIMADIKTALAGYTAEKIKYKETSTGVFSDFKHAMALAHRMVWSYGMGTNGFVGDFTVIPENQISDDMKDRLNQEVQTILHQAAQEVEAFLRSEWALVDIFAKALLEKNELDYDDIETVFKAHGKERVSL
ncbi:MAG: AAA family ATPase [Elusimicrobiota bacterium]|jgi:cell division protease FtsH